MENKDRICKLLEELHNLAFDKDSNLILGQSQYFASLSQNIYAAYLFGDLENLAKSINEYMNKHRDKKEIKKKGFYPWFDSLPDNKKFIIFMMLVCPFIIPFGYSIFTKNSIFSLIFSVLWLFGLITTRLIYLAKKELE